MKRRRRLNIESLEDRSLLSGLAINITTNAPVYQPGQPVHLTFTETNTGSQSITVRETPSLDGFIVKQGSQIVWQSNAGINPFIIVDRTLDPGQSLTLQATWNGEPTNGSSASGPETGTFVAFDQMAPGVTVTFQISDSNPTSVNPPTSPSPTPPSDPITPSPVPPSSPIAPDPPRSAPISPTDPAPINTTSGGNASTGRHRHQVHQHLHHPLVRLAIRPQLGLRAHHMRPRMEMR
jgi:hypothetical protein